MTKNLVIVESPAKAVTIAKYLNSSAALKKMGVFEVVSSMGHIRDIEKKGLGIDIEAGFVPTYVVTEEKKDRVKELKKKAASSDLVWIASDYDREGEGIAAHLREVLGLKRYKRITFTEITQKALEAAVLNPRQLDMDLVDSQETRRVLDRLVGFKLSPVLWKVYKTESITGLSAGRVQSAVMHIVLEREKEIKGFDTRCYWYFLGCFVMKAAGATHEMEDVRMYKEGEGVHKEEDGKAALGVLKKIKGEWKISDVKSREARKNADLPYITSTLQQDAYNKMGFQLKYAMSLAQGLYEKGYITYMRTDSYNISEDFKAAAQAYVVEEWGAQYWSGGSAKKKAAAKGAQEAHEAIRPTKVDLRAEGITGLGDDHRKLYDMIWKRTVAYFMAPCVMDELDIKIVDPGIHGAGYFFQATFSKVKFNGFMAVYGVESEVYDFKKYIDGIRGTDGIGKYDLRCKRVTAKNTWQSPPARYNESSIIKALEAEGIGRPSTYAGIMQKLYDKRYLVKSDVQGVDKPTLSWVYEGPGKVKEERGSVPVGAERTRLVPSEIGERVDGFLEQNFPYIIDRRFTASMENDLDHIAEGTKKRLDVLGAFWKVFGKDVGKFDGYKGEKVMLKIESNIFRINNKDYKVRMAKYGPVIEYDGEAGKKAYVNLTPFLKMHKKEMGDVTEEDIVLLTGLPRSIGRVDGKPFELVYGKYGFYGRHDGNIKIPMKTVWAILGGKATAADLKGCVDYAKNKEKEKAGVGLAAKKKVVKKRAA